MSAFETHVIIVNLQDKAAEMTELVDCVRSREFGDLAKAAIALEALATADDNFAVTLVDPAVV